MYPELFHLSFLHTYGVLVALAFLAGLWIAARLGKREGLNAEALTNLVIYCALAAIGSAAGQTRRTECRSSHEPGDLLRAGGHRRRQAHDVRGGPALPPESGRNFHRGHSAGGRGVLWRVDRRAGRGLLVHA